jgi:hypothetical protein
MVMPEDNPPRRRTTNFQRMNSTRGWAIVGAAVLIVLAIIFFSTRRHTPANTGEQSPATTPQPNTTTQPNTR